MRSVARELVLLQVAPDPLVGVQLRRVPWEAVHLQAGLCGQEGAYHLRPVMGPAVPEDHDRPTADRAEQVAEERDYLRTADRAWVHSKLQTASRGDSTDRRELRPAALVDWHRGLADRSPGLGDIRDEREPTLIDTHYDGPSLPSFFL